MEKKKKISACYRVFLNLFRCVSYIQAVYSINSNGLLGGQRPHPAILPNKGIEGSLVRSAFKA